MAKEFSAGMIVYNPKIKKYLVLEYESHWGFVKGGIEKGENEKETAIRELEEETGISNFKFEKFKEKFREIPLFYCRANFFTDKGIFVASGEEYGIRQCVGIALGKVKKQLLKQKKK